MISYRLEVVILMVTSISILACAIATPLDSGRGQFVAIEKIPKLSSSMDGKIIETEGYVQTSDEAANIASETIYSKTQVCIGLLVSEKDLAELKPFDNQLKKIAGRLNSHRCVGKEFCPHTCGPVVLEDAKISER